MSILESNIKRESCFNATLQNTLSHEQECVTEFSTAKTWLSWKESLKATVATDGVAIIKLVEPDMMDSTRVVETMIIVIEE